MMLGAGRRGGHIGDFTWIPGITITGEFWGLAAIAGAVFTSYARSLAEANGSKMKGQGIIERPERILIFCFFGLIGQLTLGIIILAILGNATVAQRLYYFHKTNINK